MSDNPIQRPVLSKSFGLALLLVIDLVVLGYLGIEGASIENYKTSTSGSYTMAEASYVTSLWVKHTTSYLGLLVFNAICIGIAIVDRISENSRVLLYINDLHREAKDAQSDIVKN